MPELLPVETFVTESRRLPVLDVRTPDEYQQGHIPGAVNLPLFSNDERAAIGITYKEEGRHTAMLRGLDLAGPRLRTMVEHAEDAISGEEVLLHCWRGGMRSASVAWLLGFFGYRVRRLDGGYKAYRRFVLDTLAQPRPLRILSGKTGAGKTEVLHALQACGVQAIDLEGLACHEGSVFGGLGEPTQPTQQQFENELAHRWHALDPAQPLWLEDESRRIGTVNIPKALWDQMQTAAVYVVDVPTEAQRSILCDPQTSGGLLFAADPDEAGALQAVLAQHGLEGHTTPIGRMEMQRHNAPLIEVN